MDTKREQIMEFLETLPTPIDVLSLVDIGRVFTLVLMAQILCYQ